MGTNGAGSVNLGGGSEGGTGFNPAAMMAGMALGGAIGQNMAGMVGNMMSGVNQSAQPPITPPPVPNIVYHVAVNGKATGPFDLTALKALSSARTTASTWTPYWRATDRRKLNICKTEAGRCPPPLFFCGIDIGMTIPHHDHYRRRAVDV